MKEYLLSVIGTVLLSALITAIIPEGKIAGVIKGIAKLVCILAIIAPVLYFFDGGNLTNDKFMETFFNQTGIEEDEAVIKYYSELRIAETEKLLEKDILDRFSQETEIDLEWEYITETIDENYLNQEVKITRICVQIEGKINEEVTKKMWEYLTKNYCSEVLLE